MIKEQFDKDILNTISECDKLFEEELSVLANIEKSEREAENYELGIFNTR